MVQEFTILRCFACATFQVHQIKKSKKWNCKVCGEKQSIKKVFMQGSGQECRKQVQRMNLNYGTAYQVAEWSFGSKRGCDLLDDSVIRIDFDHDSNSFMDENCLEFSTRKNKWDRFLDPSDTGASEAADTDDHSVTTDRNKFDQALLKRKKNARKSYNKQFSPKNVRRYSQWNTYNQESNKMWGQDENFNEAKKFSMDTNLNRAGTQAQVLPSLSINPGSGSQRSCDVLQSVCNNSKESVFCEDSQTRQPSLKNVKFCFTKVTREPEEIQPLPTVNSKWFKFMPNSSNQNSEGESGEENCASLSVQSHIEAAYQASGLGDHRRFNHEQHKKRQTFKSQSSGMAESVTKWSSTTEMQTPEDLFKVEDELDEGWWDSV